ncbi:Uma2 family endonuclease [Streptomyces sp. NPDC052396]|uniref:Uma2 family endonuclease n=1 Tax=Streptomyces sp. NPDC052396 TaxID=3365689 RepID=UPI0037CF0F37
MTTQLERPVTTEEMRKFEELDAAFPDYHAEMIDGEVYFETVVTSAHGQMVMAIGAQLLAHWCVMTEVDTLYEGWRGKTIVRPDISVADPSYRGNQLRQFPAEEVILMVEVVSESNPENDTRRKLRKYAQAGIPLYLIVNPLKGECLLHSLPSGDHYRGRVESKFGDPITLGEPLNTTLDTSALYAY